LLPSLPSPAQGRPFCGATLLQINAGDKKPAARLLHLRLKTGIL
jgi:hypothetical protein